MKKTLKVLGIIAIVAVIGFSMAGCEDPYGNDSSTEGRLTINGLSSYNGWQISVYPAENSKKINVTVSNNPEGLVFGTVSNDSATYYVWEWKHHSDFDYATSYTGNDQNVKFSVQLSDNRPGSSGDSASCDVTVNFSNGKASVPFVPNP